MAKREGRSKATPRPLPELLSDALLTLTRLYEDAGAGDDPPPSLTMWSGLLRGLRPDGITVRELTREVRLSNRAVLGWLGAAATSGYLVPERSGRARVGDRIEVTDKWRAAAEEWPGVAKAAGKAWVKQAGAGAAKELRSALEPLVSGFALELPHYPVPYGPVDWTMTGGDYRKAKPGPPRLPSHGADWSPVIRSDGETVSGLALPALVSQALVNFQIDGESAGCYPQLVIDVLRRIPKGGVPLAASPPIAHVDEDGKSGYVRHGILALTGKRGAQRVGLTPLAERVLARYEAAAAEIESRWHEEYGDETVARVRAALEAVAPSLDAPSDPPHQLWVICEPGHAFVEATQRKKP